MQVDKSSLISNEERQNNVKKLYDLFEVLKPGQGERQSTRIEQMDYDQSKSLEEYRQSLISRFTILHTKIMEQQSANMGSNHTITNEIPAPLPNPTPPNPQRSTQHQAPRPVLRMTIPPKNTQNTQNLQNAQNLQNTNQNIHAQHVNNQSSYVNQQNAQGYGNQPNRLQPNNQYQMNPSNYQASQSNFAQGIANQPQQNLPHNMRPSGAQYQQQTQQPQQQNQIQHNQQQSAGYPSNRTMEYNARYMPGATPAPSQLQHTQQQNQIQQNPHFSQQIMTSQPQHTQQQHGMPQRVQSQTSSIIPQQPGLPHSRAGIQQAPQQHQQQHTAPNPHASNMTTFPNQMQQYVPQSQMQPNQTQYNQPPQPQQQRVQQTQTQPQRAQQIPQTTSHISTRPMPPSHPYFPTNQNQTAQSMHNTQQVQQHVPNRASTATSTATQQPHVQPQIKTGPLPQNPMQKVSTTITHTSQPPVGHPQHQHAAQQSQQVPPGTQAMPRQQHAQSSQQSQPMKLWEHLHAHVSKIPNAPLTWTQLASRYSPQASIKNLTSEDQKYLQEYVEFVKNIPRHPSQQQQQQQQQQQHATAQAHASNMMQQYPASQRQHPTAPMAGSNVPHAKVPVGAPKAGTLKLAVPRNAPASGIAKQPTYIQNSVQNVAQTGQQQMQTRAVPTAGQESKPTHSQPHPPQPEIVLTTEEAKSILLNLFKKTKDNRSKAVSAKVKEFVGGVVPKPVPEITPLLPESPWWERRKKRPAPDILYDSDHIIESKVTAVKKMKVEEKLLVANAEKAFFFTKAASDLQLIKDEIAKLCSNDSFFRSPNLDNDIISLVPFIFPFCVKNEEARLAPAPNSGFISSPIVPSSSSSSSSLTFDGTPTHQYCPKHSRYNCTTISSKTGPCQFAPSDKQFQRRCIPSLEIDIRAPQNGFLPLESDKALFSSDSPSISVKGSFAFQKTFECRIRKLKQQHRNGPPQVFVRAVLDSWKHFLKTLYAIQKELSNSSYPNIEFKEDIRKTRLHKEPNMADNNTKTDLLNVEAGILLNVPEQPDLPPLFVVIPENYPLESITTIGIDGDNEKVDKMLFIKACKNEPQKTLRRLIDIWLSLPSVASI